MKMIERKIKLEPKAVKEFVNVASQCDFDIDISYNHVTVDAKSILGVLGLELANLLTVRYNGYNRGFEDYLQKMSVAC